MKTPTLLALAGLATIAAGAADADQRDDAAKIEALALGLEGDAPPHHAYALLIDGCEARFAGGRLAAHFSLASLDYDAAVRQGTAGPVELRARPATAGSPLFLQVMKKKFAELRDPPRVIACFIEDERTVEQIDDERRLSRSRRLTSSYARLLEGYAGEHYRQNHIVHYRDLPGLQDVGELAEPLVSGIEQFSAISFRPRQSPQERKVNDNFAEVGRLIVALSDYAGAYCGAETAAD